MTASQTLALQILLLAVLLPVLIWSGTSYIKAVYAPHPDNTPTPEYQWTVDLTDDGQFIVRPIRKTV